MKVSLDCSGWTSYNNFSVSQALPLYLDTNPNAWFMTIPLSYVYGVPGQVTTFDAAKVQKHVMVEWPQRTEAFASLVAAT